MLIISTEIESPLGFHKTYSYLPVIRKEGFFNKNKMENIINNNVLLREIKRIVEQEIKIVKEQVDSLWKLLNQIDERVKTLENEK